MKNFSKKAVSNSARVRAKSSSSSTPLKKSKRPVKKKNSSLSSGSIEYLPVSKNVSELYNSSFVSKSLHSSSPEVVFHTHLLFSINVFERISALYFFSKPSSLKKFSFDDRNVFSYFLKSVSSKDPSLKVRQVASDLLNKIE